MLKRFLGFVLVGALLLGFGMLFYMNPAIVELHVTASRSCLSQSANKRSRCTTEPA